MPSVVPSPEVTNGLNALWPLQETSGSVEDIIGGNDGTNNGATKGASGPAGANAYDFDGTDDNVFIPSGVVGNNTDFAISAHVSVEGGSGEKQAIFAAQNDIDATVLANLADTNNCAFKIFDGSNPNVIEGQGIINDGFVHVLAQQDSGGMELYVDGSLEASNNFSNRPVPISNESNIGDRDGQFGGSPHLHGKVADVRVYSRSLSDSEISTVSNNVVDPDALSAPTNLSASVTGDDVTISWDAADGASEYNVLRAETSGTTAADYPTTVATVSDDGSASFSVTDTGLEDGERFFYRVESVS